MPSPDSSPAGPDALVDPGRVGALLGALACRFDIDAVAACESTNSLLGARRCFPSGRVVVADRQSDGRGRRGRRWVSDPVSSLTFSLLWRFARPAAQMAGLSLAVGVALLRALSASGFAGIGLKWPNDVLRREGDSWCKVGGVLVELSADGAGSEAVIGIGLNLGAPAGLEVEASTFPAGGLVAAGAAIPDRHHVLAAVLGELVPVLDGFASDGFAPFAGEWQQAHAFSGRMVRLEEEGRLQAEGLCAGVDEVGALLVEVDGRLARWVSGDLSLRPA